MPVVLVAQDAADNLAIHDNRPDEHGFIGQDPAPVGQKGLPVVRVLGGKGRPVIGVRVQLLLK